MSMFVSSTHLRTTRCISQLSTFPNKTNVPFINGDSTIHKSEKKTRLAKLRSMCLDLRHFPQTQTTKSFDDPGHASTAKNVCDSGTGRNDFVRARMCFVVRRNHSCDVSSSGSDQSYFVQNRKSCQITYGFEIRVDHIATQNQVIRFVCQISSCTTDIEQLLA